VMGIVTDSDGDVPTNVYAIHRLVKTAEQLAPLYEEHRGRYKALKDALVDDLDAFIAPMRAKYEALGKSPEKVAKILSEGGKKANKKAEQKMKQVRKAGGVRELLLFPVARVLCERLSKRQKEGDEWSFKKSLFLSGN
ncbi:MAG: hypothetical protein AAB921_02015, partial [Patescibacteria group bacterium]